MATLPPDRFLRLDRVLDRTGLSRATLYRKIGAGTFPPQYKIAERCCGWRESEVELWMRNPITFTIEDIPTPLHQHYVANNPAPHSGAG